MSSVISEQNIKYVYKYETKYNRHSINIVTVVQQKMEDVNTMLKQQLAWLVLLDT